MKFIRSLYHFLAGIYFALILIASVALFVIFGTFIESFTQSHRYAALFTYDNPVFGMLLWGFFINILFSAIRRWPFQKKHGPFLITHLGLLMILAGVLAKHYFGVQGTMSLAEGTASDEILLSNTYAIHVENKNLEPTRYPLRKNLQGDFKGLIAQNDHTLSIHLAEFQPHCTEHLAGWVKKSHAFIGGYKPIPLYHVAEKDEILPLGGQAKLHHPESFFWDLYALKTSDPEKTIVKLYTQHARATFTDRIKKEIIREIPLEMVLKDQGELVLNFIPKKGLTSTLLKINRGNQDRVSIPLSGDQALLNLHEGPQLSHLPIAIDIIQKPFFAVIQDDDEDVYLVASDPYGKIWLQPCAKGNLDVLIAYDDGFAGYTTRAIVPFKEYPDSRLEREEALVHQFTLQLKQALEEGTALAPPLQIMFDACNKAKIDFPDAATLFFSHWNDSGHWIYQENIPLPECLKQVFASLDWSGSNSSIKQGCEWVTRLFDQITPELNRNKCLITTLRNHGWPLLESLEHEVKSNQDKDQTFAYTFLTHQLFAASEMRPSSSLNNESDVSPEHQAALLSAYLRAFGIHFSTVLPVPSEKELDEMVLAYLSEKYPEKNIDSSTITLETLVSPKQQEALPLKKLEENKPKVVLFFNDAEHKQILSLGYEPTGKGLKWPILDGKYLVRFQPLFEKIPYHVRLRQARQINYANSSQPYSYEGDLIFNDKKRKALEEKTISMNQVHETWDGYRFYLSSIAPGDESAVKQVQIVVNYDPAKYFLTYPGAIVLSCGILMLFILRPYKRTKRDNSDNRTR